MTVYLLLIYSKGLLVIWLSSITRQKILAVCGTTFHTGLCCVYCFNQEVIVCKPGSFL